MTSSLDMIRGRQVVQSLTNQSGGSVIAGDVVIVSAANDESFTTTTSAAYNSTRVGVAQETIAASAAGRILLEGYAPLVNVSASATRGYYLFTHTVAKQATSASSYAAGAFGQILKAGTTPSAVIFPVAQVGSAGDVATDAIWDAAGDLAVGTGANTAARLAAGAAGAVLAMGNSAVIWNAGTSFPGSKATGDRYWRTDLGMEFYWDGTRWLSTQVFYESFNGLTVNNGDIIPFPVSRSGDYLGYSALWNPTYSTYWLGAYFLTRVQTTNNGSNYWNVIIDDNSTVSITQSTSADSPDTTYHRFVVSNSVAAASNNKFAHWYAIVGAGTPGELFFVAASLVYRLIAT